MAFLDEALARVPVDRITAEAREIRFWRTVLTVIAGLLFGVSWLVARGVTLVWLALTWTFTALKVGWQEGRKPASSRR